LSCFSFYANKILTTGEGGMVLTNDEDHVKRLRSLRNLCFQQERRFYHSELGYNFRMTNIQAAIGVGQLERFNELVKRKRGMGAAYSERLKDIEGLQIPVEEPWATNVYWMYGVVLDKGRVSAGEFAKRLAERGVMTRPFFVGMHEQPVFQKRGMFHEEHYPVAERIARHGLYLPSGLALTESQLEEVCESIHEILR